MDQKENQRESYESLLKLLSDATHLPIHLFIEEEYISHSPGADGTKTDSPFTHDRRLFGQLIRNTSGNALLADKDFETIFYGILSPSPKLWQRGNLMLRLTR